ncbi:MAG TPA: SRPBCC family protein [Gemmatimonadaceae bacterium]|nr:SRPBCC family protein [Gemmatimonadaceae bacterium]
MKIDVARQIGAVTRVVRNRMHDGKPARVVIASRTYDTTVEDLWDALTSAERIPRWFMPISGDLQLGGRYQLQGNAGGTITACEPPKHVALTWEFGGDVSWVDVTLAATDDGRAHLELEHTAHVPDNLWDQFGPGAVGVGWDSALAGLERDIAGDVMPPLAERMAWLASAEGNEFVRLASADWGRASIASGADEAAATSAAARTTAAYTGAPG